MVLFAGICSVLVTRVDAQILAVYRRHIHYRKYYAAQSGIHAKVPAVKPSVPVYQGIVFPKMALQHRNRAKDIK